MQVGLSLGPSFAELCVTSSKETTAGSKKSPLFQSRAYLPKENLSACFQKLKDHFSAGGSGESKAEPIEKITVSCRYLEKIFETKLGGSVAQVLTSGFETWPVLRQPVNPDHFVTHPLRAEPLASQEHIFGITERINAKGEVLKAVDPQSLEFIASKLKLMEIKKVCVNLLFAGQNPEHQEQVKNYFVEQGFEVFCSPRGGASRDEVSSWRNHILNACLSGTFLEILSDIQKATVGLVEPDKIYFIDSKGESHQRPLNHLSSLLFGWTSKLPADSLILNLGLESWSLIESNTCQKWQSPWGSVDVPHRKTTSLRVQPTQEIETDLWGELAMSARSASYEPGPMSWGRARKPLLVDILFSQLPSVAEEFQTLMAPAGVQRYKDTLRILQRNSAAQQSMDLMLFEKSLFERVLIEIEMAIPSKSVLLTGFFAEPMLPHLKKQAPHIDWKLAPQSQSWEAQSVAQA